MGPVSANQRDIDQKMVELWEHPGFRHLCGTLRDRARAQVVDAALAVQRDDAKLTRLAAKLEVLNDLKAAARALAIGANERLAAAEAEDDK